ncbi:hypothetical protein [Paracoccus rhizosphaerae]|uniref:Uncharacterized protein n=1 Tax=Paracoccus rhizosphaerae TaxID=1133347 RepID=A0ABV6CIZ9_9RHOB|nr:hypothetical protein [Paracoccus rhizosphaerae]
MTVVEVVLCSLAVAYAAGVAIAVWRTLPNPADIEPDMKLVAEFIASTPREELRRIMEPKD